MTYTATISEFGLGKFGYARLDKIAIKIFKGFCQKATCVLNRAAINRPEQAQMNRFIWNGKVTIEKIINNSLEKTSKLAAGHEHFS